MAHTHYLIEAQFFHKREELKTKKKKSDEMVSFKKRILCVSFSSCSSLAKSCHKVSM